MILEQECDGGIVYASLKDLSGVNIKEGRKVQGHKLKP